MNTEKDLGFINETIEHLSGAIKLSRDLTDEYMKAWERIKRLEGFYYRGKEKSPINASLLDKPQKELEIVIKKLLDCKNKIEAFKREKR